MSNVTLVVLLLSTVAYADEADRDPELAPMAPAAHTITSAEDFAARVLRGNADVAVTHAEIERVRGVARQALAQLLPNLSATANAQYMQPSNVTFSSSTATTAGGLDVTTTSFIASGSVSLSQSLVSPRDWYAQGTNRRAIASAEASAQDRVRTTLMQAAEDAIAERSAARSADVSRVGLRSALEVVKLTARKVELGDAAPLDLVRTEQDVESARALVISADEALRKARETVGLVLGSTQPVGFDDSLPIASIEVAMTQRCSARPAADRPDVVAAKTETEIARRKLRDTKLAYLPSLGLSSQLSASTNAMLGQNWSFNLVATLSVPIWDGGAREGATRSATASLAQKAAQLGAVERAATVQQTQTSRGVQVATAARTVSERNRTLAAKVAKMTRTAFAEGSGTTFDLVEAARKAREAELDLVGKEYDLVRANIDARLAASTCSR